jgi:hypothetical protein
MINLKAVIALTSLSLFAAIPSQAAEVALTEWSEHISKNIAGAGTIVIPAIPGTPSVTTPAVTTRAPCGMDGWNIKYCTVTVIPAVTIPGIPGVPAITHDMSQPITTVSVGTDGGVYASTEGFVEVENHTNIAMFGSQVTVPVSCKVQIGNTIKVSIDLFTGKVTSNGPAECNIGTIIGGLPSMPGTEAAVIIDMTVLPNPGQTNTVGSGSVRLESSINMGSATGFGHTVNFGSMAWNPVIANFSF